MKTLPRLIAVLPLLSSVPAHAIVGGGAPPADGVARSVVTIVGSRGNFCTGALIAPNLVLTAAHCVPLGAEYRIVEYGPDRQPKLQDVKRVAIHPGFNMQAMSGHRATADVALLQLAATVKGKTPSVLGLPNIPINVGSRFTIAGIGVTAYAATARAAARSASLRWSQPASPARCRSAWSIRSDGARATGWGPAPEIPADLCSRTRKAGR